MSENNKDNKEFEFIKEQVIEKKRRKLKKLLFPTITNIGFAVLFGATAAVTFVILEPRIHKMMEQEEVTPTVCFPTECPQEEVKDTTDGQGKVTSSAEPTPEPVIVEQSIDADMDDYISMNDEIRNVAYKVDQSIVNVSGIISVKDWFGNSVDKTVKTTGLVVYNTNKEFLILVSFDRIEDADRIKIVLSENVSVDAALQDYYSDINLAVISVAIADIPEDYINNIQPATLGEYYTVNVGTPILALGNPNGYLDSMAVGMVTSKGSVVNIVDNTLELFNTSIQDNENSDGVIVNMEGEVIGLITRTLKENFNNNINTVINISELKPIIELMIKKEPHIYFGVKTDDMTQTAKTEYNIENGIYIKYVMSDSPAFNAGIQKGDIILKINDHPIVNTSDFNKTISTYKPGDKLDVVVLRNNGSSNQEVDIKVTLSETSK